MRLNNAHENQYMKQMILLYSDYCPHCRMLLDTIKRHDVKKQIKTVSIDALRVNNKPVPKQIHSVPALILLPGNDILYGKQVFDYLLLPGKGKLLVGVNGGSEPNDDIQRKPNEVIITTDNSGPSAYSIHMNGLSESFSTIEDKEHPMDGLDDRSYKWTSIKEQSEINVTVPAAAPLQEETRSKRNTLDLDAYKAQRELELKQSDINTSQLPPPSFTR